MASPHVAGAAALVLAHRPALTPLELKNTLLLSVDKTPAYSGAVKTGGRLNVARALGQEVKPPTGLTASSPSHAAGWSGNSTVQIVWGGATDENGIRGYSYALSPVADFVPDEVKDTLATTSTMPLPDGVHWFHVRAVDTQGNWGQALHVGADPDRHVPAGAAGALEPEPPGGRRLGRPDDRRRVERRVGRPEWGLMAMRSHGLSGGPGRPRRSRTSRRPPRA